MSYRVFARKYRPQTFEQVVGQDHITRTLQNAIESNRLAQAYLFVGPRGIGKTSTARILAKALNCVNGPTISPCGTCDACIEIAAGNSLDVLEIDGASNNSVEHIRELRENAAFAPARGPFKIYLVDEVHMLSTPAFNALLKTLEEPPSHVKFIFATTEAQKVPATITSRCQRFDLRRIPSNLIAAHLQLIANAEGITLADDAAAAVAKGADGGLRDAESMLDQLVAFCGDKITAEDVLTVFGFTSHETVEALLSAVFHMDAASALDIVAGQSEAGKDLSRLMSDVIGQVRDMLVRHAVPGDASEGGPTLEKLLSLLDHFAEAESRLRWTTDKRLYFDVAIIKAVHLLDQTSLSDVIDTLAAIGEGRDVAPKAPPKAAAEHPRTKPTSAPAPVKSVPLPSTTEAAPKPVDFSRITREEKKPEPIEESQPAPVADPVSTPAPVAAPPATSEESMPIKSDHSDAGAIWLEVKEALGADSVIRFGWLLSGDAARQTGENFIVRFAQSLEGNTQDFFWDDVKKDVEERLHMKLGKKVTFTPDFTGAELAAPAEPDIALEPEAPPEPEPADATPDQPGAESFHDDPKIQQALHIFKAQLETSKS